MIDWQQAAQHVSALGIGPDDALLLALFPPKPTDGQRPGGCIYIEVSPRTGWKRENVEAQLEQRPGYSLGAIFNPGGTKNAEIKFCRFLMFEDDGEGGFRGEAKSVGSRRFAAAVVSDLDRRQVRSPLLVAGKPLHTVGVQGRHEATCSPLPKGFARSWNRLCIVKSEPDPAHGGRYSPLNRGDGSVFKCRRSAI